MNMKTKQENLPRCKSTCVYSTQILSAASLSATHMCLWCPQLSLCVIVYPFTALVLTSVYCRHDANENQNNRPHLAAALQKKK